MKLKARKLKYYGWDDIEARLCFHLGIPVDKFRDYHLHVGGEYKDFWHVWLELNPDITNGSFDYTSLDEECWGWLLEKLSKTTYGIWVMDLAEPLRKLKEEVELNMNDSVYIYYNW